MHRERNSSLRYAAGAITARVCGLALAGIAAPAVAWAAPSESDAQADGKPSRAASAAPSNSNAGPGTSGRTTPGRRAIGTADPGKSPGPAASQIRRRPAAPVPTAAAVTIDLPRPDVANTAPPVLSAPTPAAVVAQVAPGQNKGAFRAAPTRSAVVAIEPTRSAVPLPAATVLTTAPARVSAAASGPTPAPVTPSPASAKGTLNAIATGNPAPVGNATLPTGSISDFITGLMQLTRRWFFNTPPTAAAQQALTRPNGQTWGFLTASDAEGEQIDYAVTRNGKFGTASVTPSGVYTYTPGAGFTGTDSFTVTLRNPGFHINLRDLFDGQRRELTITVVASDGASVGDDFDGAAGSAPDPALWGYHLGPHRDHGLQTYTDSPDNVRLDGQGNLVIQAHDTGNGYTSTRLVTQDKLTMQYGSVQARIKAPAGQGIWPSFWMLGATYYPDEWWVWPACGEIDIMEVVNDGRRYNVALHGPQGSTDYYGGAAVSGQFVGAQGLISDVAPINDLTEDFHDYWTIWREDHIVVGVDGTTLAEFTPASLPAGGEWVFNQPMYAIAQISVGGDWPGPPDETTPWPATMLVDSFRYTPLS